MALGPVIAAGVTALGSIAASALNVREARRNREFQERMSNTGHQREVRDLRAAGINPMIRSMSGASTPSGDRGEVENPVSGAVASALAVKRAQAEIDLLESQDLKTRIEARAIEQEWSVGGKGRRLASEADLAELSVAEKRSMIPLALERAREEIRLTVSSAQAAKARALLDQAAREGALNQEAFERLVGTMGPAARFFFTLVRGMK